jgi:hypothetical protein
MRLDQTIIFASLTFGLTYCIGCKTESREQSRGSASSVLPPVAVTVDTLNRSLQDDSHLDEDLANWVRVQFLEDSRFPRSSKMLRSIDELATIAQVQKLGIAYSEESSPGDYPDYAFSIDIDGDSLRDLIVSQLGGSSREQYFCMAKFDPTSNAYVLVTEIDGLRLRPAKCRGNEYSSDLVPITHRGKHYLIDRAFDFNSKRVQALVVYEITRSFTVTHLGTICIDWQYTIPASLESYVSRLFLQALPTRAIDLEDGELVLPNGDTLIYDVWHTSVGYMPSTIDLSIATSGGRRINFDDVFGFDTVSVAGAPYLVIASDRGVMEIKNLTLTVVSLTSYKTVTKEILNAEPRLDGAP